MQSREPRLTVKLSARMKTAQGWQVVAIRNVSAHGMRVQLSVPIKRGAYLEVRRAAQTIVARAVWVDGKECGLRTQDVVDIPALVDPKAAAAERVAGEMQADRHHLPRPADSAERARRIVQRLRFCVMGVAVLAVAGYAALTVGSTLLQPLRKINQALAGMPAG